MNKLVNIEIAKLLHEKGWNIPCREGWVNYLASFTGETRMPDDESNLVLDTLGNTHLIERPTIGEVIMWLYEKHQIWINIFSDKSLNWKNIFSIRIDWVYPKDTPDSEDIEPKYYKYKVNNEFNSPIKAYEAAIEYTLSNLI